MVISLVSNIYNLIKKAGTKLSVVGGLLGRFVCLHFATSNDALLDDSLSCLLHGLKHLSFLLLSKIFVKLTAPLVLALTKLAVFRDNLFALVGAPHLIVKLLLLVALVLDQLYNHCLALLELELLHVLLLLANESSAALLPLFTGGFSQSFLGSLFKSGRLEGERARFSCNGSAHGTLSKSSGSSSAGTKSRLATLLVEACIDCTIGVSFLDSRVNTIRFQSILKGIDSIRYLILGVLQLFLGYNIEFLSLLEIKFELFAFAVTLAFLILFPVFDTLLVPLLHETCVALKFINLNAPHFLFTHRSHLFIVIVATACEIGLTVLLLVKLQKMGLHIELLLWLVKGIDANFEELVLNTVIFLL